MKLAVTVLTSFFAVSAMAIDKVSSDNTISRTETRTRVLGEKLTAVSACTEPTVTSYEYADPYIKADGTIASNSDGSMKMKKMTRIKATSELKIAKCQTSENFMVSVTGKFWNSDVSEIPNSGKEFSRIVMAEQTFSQTQDVDLRRLGGAVNDATIFSTGGELQILNTIIEGVKAQAKSDCERTAAQLRASVTNKANTACK